MNETSFEDLCLLVEAPKATNGLIKSKHHARKIAVERDRNGLKEFNAIVDRPGLPLMFCIPNLYRWAINQRPEETKAA